MRQQIKGEKWGNRLMGLTFWLIAAPVVLLLLCCGGYAIWLAVK